MLQLINFCLGSNFSMNAPAPSPSLSMYNALQERTQYHHYQFAQQKPHTQCTIYLLGFSYCIYFFSFNGFFPHVKIYLHYIFSTKPAYSINEKFYFFCLWYFLLRLVFPVSNYSKKYRRKTVNLWFHITFATLLGYIFILLK